MDGLTEAQERCLNTINCYMRKNQSAPTRQELAELLGEKSTNGANQKLSQLEKKGYVRIHPKGKKRNILILRNGNRQLDLFGD